MAHRQGSGRHPPGGRAVGADSLVVGAPRAAPAGARHANPNWPRRGPRKPWPGPIGHDADHHPFVVGANGRPRPPGDTGCHRSPGRTHHSSWCARGATRCWPRERLTSPAPRSATVHRRRSRDRARPSCERFAGLCRSSTCLLAALRCLNPLFGMSSNARMAGQRVVGGSPSRLCPGPWQPRGEVGRAVT